MKKENYSLAGLTFRGEGFFTFDDISNPRMSNIEIAIKVGTHLGKRVQHISRNSYVGHTRHVLQYSYLYNKDMHRKISKLKDKFNSR
jgi:hypothetical protein